MASGQSEVDISNFAMDILEEEYITSLSQDTKAARWLNRNFAQTRDAVLRAHPWNFAMERTTLLADSTDPAFGWTYRYAVPADCLRPMPLTQNGKLNGAQYPFEYEGGYVLTDATAPLKFRYIKRETDPAIFDNLFIEALSARLAAKAAHLITGKASQQENALKIYTAAIAEARIIDGLEGTPEAVLDEDVLDARL